VCIIALFQSVLPANVPDVHLDFKVPEMDSNAMRYPE